MTKVCKAPVRIQRRRTKGWKMPENTVYVGRGSIFGNPFRIGYFEPMLNRALRREDCVQLYRAGLLAADALDTPFSIYHENQNNLYQAWVRHSAAHPLPKSHDVLRGTAELALMIEMQMHGLRGKNLACWCSLNQPCHADVLLELANQTDAPLFEASA